MFWVSKAEVKSLELIQRVWSLLEKRHPDLSGDLASVYLKLKDRVKYANVELTPDTSDRESVGGVRTSERSASAAVASQSSKIEHHKVSAAEAGESPTDEPDQGMDRECEHEWVASGGESLCDKCGVYVACSCRHSTRPSRS